MQSKPSWKQAYQPVQDSSSLYRKARKPCQQLYSRKVISPYKFLLKSDTKVCTLAHNICSRKPNVVKYSRVSTCEPHQCQYPSSVCGTKKGVVQYVQTRHDLAAKLIQVRFLLPQERSGPHQVSCRVRYPRDTIKIYRRRLKLTTC